MRTAATILTLLFIAPTAQAGGVGLLLNGGLHTEKVWFYSSHNFDGEEPIPYESIDDYDQLELVQTLTQFGSGLELTLGDRDDRVMGNFRFYYQQDSPQKDPAALTSLVKPEYVVAAYRETPRHVGVAAVGLSWGIFGDPSGFQVGAMGHVGSGFLTTDHTEYLTADIGPMVTYKLNRQLQFFGDAAYVVRFHKGFSNGAQATTGIRYLFD
jgi:hypothetical protein